MTEIHKNKIVEKEINERVNAYEKQLRSACMKIMYAP